MSAALNLKPYTWNWATCTAGDTYPAENWRESESDNLTTLTRVRIKIRDSDGVLFALLDSNTTGIVINASTAGAWEWTVSALTAPTTAGIYTVDMEWTDSAGVVFTETSGKWGILPQQTD